MCSCDLSVEIVFAFISLLLSLESFTISVVKISVDCTYTVLIEKFEIRSNFGRRVVLVRLILFGQRQSSGRRVQGRLCIRWVHGCIPNSVHRNRHVHLPNGPIQNS